MSMDKFDVKTKTINKSVSLQIETINQVNTLVEKINNKIKYKGANFSNTVNYLVRLSLQQFAIQGIPINTDGGEIQFTFGEKKK